MAGFGRRAPVQGERCPRCTPQGLARCGRAASRRHPRLCTNHRRHTLGLRLDRCCPGGPGRTRFHRSCQTTRSLHGRQQRQVLPQQRQQHTSHPGRLRKDGTTTSTRCSSSTTTSTSCSTRCSTPSLHLPKTSGGTRRGRRRKNFAVVVEAVVDSRDQQPRDREITTEP